jgi:hypothetical protein
MNGFIRRGIVVTLLVLLPAASAAAAPSSQPEPFPAVDGSIRAVAVDGNTAYVGGDFTRIGAASGPMALLSAADGSVQKTFPEIAARRDVGSGTLLAVHAIEPDGDGGWYVGGTFQRVAGRFRAAVVHLLGDGAVDPAFHADISGDVAAIALDRANGTLWIGGSFQRVAGEFRPYFAALDAATGELRPSVPRVRAAVSDIEIHGDRVYLLGGFDTVDEEDHVGVAALARDTGRLLDWDPRLRVGGAADLDVRDGIVYLAGSFTSVGPYDTPNAAAVRESDASVVPVDFGIRSYTGAVVAASPTAR